MFTVGITDKSRAQQYSIEVQSLGWYHLYIIFACVVRWLHYQNNKRKIIFVDDPTPTMNLHRKTVSDVKKNIINFSLKLDHFLDIHFRNLFYNRMCRATG